MNTINKLYDANGNEWHGSFYELAKTCQTYSSKSFESLSEKWVTNEKGQRVLAYEQGEILSEVRYRSEYKPGMAMPYMIVTYVWQNGRQVFPKVEE